MTTTTTGPADVAAAVRAARRVVEQVLCPAETRGSVEEWSAALDELQSLANVVAAAQDEAIVRLAAIEPEVLETGELVETHRALGHVSLDAAPIVSGVLHVSAVQAERRVREAVRRAADGPEGTVTCTGLGGLHAVMAAGPLDGYRAGVVAYELEEVPADVARAVISALEESFEREDATRLRRRVRRVLARICPDLLREKSVRARSASSLRRWVDEPGVDTWLGTFPSEEACAAWAAVDALAQRYVTDGTCERIDRARAKALTDLVTSHATIDLQVHVVAAADAPQPDGQTATTGDPGDLVAVHGAVPGEPVLVTRGWLDHAVAGTTARADRYGRVALHPDSGALTDPGENLATDAYRPGAALARLVRARDGHCRFPGCHVAARFCDLDHVLPWPTGPTAARNLACLCRRHHRVKQRHGWRVDLHPDGSMTWTDP
ncbi:MAG: HNH endonuclease, partial [Micrococcales bacterium]|nr:HNH endonuclease [Micrococcales bacterium]